MTKEDATPSPRSAGVAICGVLLSLAAVVDLALHSVTTLEYRLSQLWTLPGGPLQLARFGLAILGVMVYPVACLAAYRGSPKAEGVVFATALLRGVANLSPLALLEFFPALYVGRKVVRVAPARDPRQEGASGAGDATRALERDEGPRNRRVRERKVSRERLANGRQQLLMALASLLSALVVHHVFRPAPVFDFPGFEWIPVVTAIRDAALFGTAAFFTYRGNRFARWCLSLITVGLLIVPALAALGVLGGLVAFAVSTANSGVPSYLAALLCVIGEGVLLGSGDVRAFLEQQRSRSSDARPASDTGETPTRDPSDRIRARRSRSRDS